MLAATADGHFPDGLALLEEAAKGVLVEAVAGNVFLNQDASGPGLRLGLDEEAAKFGEGVGTPCFGLGLVEETLLDGGLEYIGRRKRNAIKFVDRERVAGLRGRDAEAFGEIVGVAFVPGPADGVPLRGGNAEKLGKERSLTGEGCDGFIAGWEDDPVLQAKTAMRGDDSFDSAVGITKIGEL
jgi:hypothetical protein